MIGITAFLRRMVLVGVVCVAWPAGCVKRAETITVRQDGSVEIRLEYKGDREDMENGAPALARAPGWEFEEVVTKNNQDEEEITRTSVATFAPGRPLPAAYPTDDFEGAELAVRHPTTLVVETRGSDTYYHFRRVYEANPWAYVKDWERVLIEEPFARGGDDVNLEDMSPTKKQELVENIILFVAEKQLAFARHAVLSGEPPLAQDAWLQLRQAVLGSVAAVDNDQVLAILEAGDGAGSDRVAELADRLNGQITGAIQVTLGRLGLRRSYIQALEKEIERQRHSFAITEDYQDEEWEITVRMPGQIVGHNGDEVEGSEVKWQFDGRRFFDRNHELLVSSKVSSITGR
ncbi:MAG: hypothetical protein IID05_14215 [Gemmatimonadetes bacterium]|nr:hypothetical protein [Gemmatimonadota bacterium]